MTYGEVQRLHHARRVLMFDIEVIWKRHFTKIEHAWVATTPDVLVVSLLEKHDLQQNTCASAVVKKWLKQEDIPPTFFKSLIA